MRIILLLLLCVCIVSEARLAAQTFAYYAEHDKRPIESHVVKRVGGQELMLLVCKPDKWRPTDKNSGIIWVHGGGWTSGEPGLFTPHMRYCAARGALSFSIQYRYTKSWRPPQRKKNVSAAENEKIRAAYLKDYYAAPAIADCITDCADAVRYIRQHANTFGIDPQRLAAIGDSSGAHLAACLGTCVPADARVNAVVACSSISDLTYKFGRKYVKPSPGLEDKEMEDDAERLKRAQAASPLFHIQHDGPPFLVLHGQKDWLGDEPQRFVTALKAAGTDVQFIEYPGVDHAFIIYGYNATLAQFTRAIRDIDAFLLQHGFLTGQSDLGPITTD